MRGMQPELEWHGAHAQDLAEAALAFGKPGAKQASQRHILRGHLRSFQSRTGIQDREGAIQSALRLNELLDCA
jgi:hypothetical protein